MLLLTDPDDPTPRITSHSKLSKTMLHKFVYLYFFKWILVEINFGYVGIFSPKFKQVILKSRNYRIVIFQILKKGGKDDLKKTPHIKLKSIFKIVIALLDQLLRRK